MTDPTGLDAKIPSPEFMDDYDTGQGAFTPPPQAKTLVAGGKPKFTVFTLQSPPLSDIKLRDDNGVFLKTAQGWLKAVVTGITEIVSGYKLGETHIGSGLYKKYDFKTKTATGEFRNASPALDYLHAHGIDSKPATQEDYEALFHATADRQFQATLDWSAYDKDTQNDVAGKWEDFPNADGSSAATPEQATEQREAFARLYPGQAAAGAKLPFIERGGKRFWARAQIKRYVSALPDSK